MSKINSKRTFGVEFELFFSKKNIIKLLNDNIKFLSNSIFLDLPTSNEEWRYDYNCLKRNITFKEYKRNAIKDAINRFMSDSDSYHFFYNVYDALDIILGNRLGLKWDVKDDGSINGGLVTAEIVTPILKGEKGLDDIKKFLTYFNKFAEVNTTCGLHVHVGANDFIEKEKSAEMYAAAILYYTTFESMFDSLVINGRRKSNNNYTKPPSSITEISKQFENSFICASDIAYLKERYTKINLHSLYDHGTFEFRHMHGTLNPTVVINWVKVCTSYVDMVKENFDEWKDVTSRNKKNITEEKIKKIKNKLGTKRGIPRGLPSNAIAAIRKANQKDFPQKMKIAA